MISLNLFYRGMSDFSSLIRKEELNGEYVPRLFLYLRSASEQRGAEVKCVIDERYSGVVIVLQGDF